MCGGAAGTGTGAGGAGGEAGSAGGSTTVGDAGASGAGTAGTGGGKGKSCKSTLDCYVPAVACGPTGGSPYQPTCIDGVCGLETVGCPPGSSAGGAGGGAGGSAGGSGGTNSGGGAGGACGEWGCCEMVSDCKSGPAVATPPCPDGSVVSGMFCTDKVCTWVINPCPG